MKPGNTLSPNVIYRDKSVLVVVKPQGMPAQPDPTGAPDALTLAAAGGALYPVHRLDRMTGGVMVFARTRAAAASLSRQLAAHEDGETGKRYLAVVSGMVTEPFICRDFLIRDARLGMAHVVTSAAGGKEARLSASPLATASFLGGDVTLLSVRLETGRFHQIRCQLSAHGHPIVGDGKYGSRVRAPLALFAESLSFYHPDTGALVTFRAPAPTDGAFAPFTEFLTARYKGIDGKS